MSRRGVHDRPSSRWTSFQWVLSLDLRALAIYRVGLALVLLYDLADRSQDLIAHYSEQGVLPAQQALSMFGRGIYLSAHYHASGSFFALACLFAAAALCGGALLVGFRTRFATLLSWYLLASLQVRNDWVNGMSGDSILLALLFWGIFLPLGERGSIDASRRSGTEPGNQVFRVATAAQILQLFVVYFSTGLLKSGETWSDGSAVYYALQVEHFATPFTHWLLEQTWAHPSLTHATRVLEIAGPFLLFVPLAAARMLAVVIFTGFHLGLAVFLNVGPFPIICIVAWLSLLPGALFDEWIPRLRARPVDAVPDALAPPARGVARWVDAALLVPLAFVVVQAAVKLGWVELGHGRALPPAAHAFGKLLRLNQNWGMFAPDPGRYSFGLGVEGRLAGGDRVDPFANTRPWQPAPYDLPGASQSYRWRAYTWTALLTKPSRRTLEASHRDFAAYLCREWNESHTGPERLVALRSIGFWRYSSAGTAQEFQPAPLYEYECGGAGRLVWSAALEPDPDAARGR